MYSFFKKLFQRSVPLYLYLFTFAVITIIAVFSLIMYSISIERIQLEQYSIKNLFQSTSEKIQQGLDYRIEPILRLAQTSTSTPIDPKILGEDAYKRAHFTQKNMRTLVYYPQLMSITYAFESGHFIYFINIDSKRNLRTSDLPKNVKFLLGYNLSDSQEENQAIIEYYDSDLKLISTITIKSDYKPKELPWYAETILENKPSFATSPSQNPNESAFTVRTPLAGSNGVYSVSSHLDTLMSFVNSTFYDNQISAYLLDANTYEIFESFPAPEHEKIFNASNCEIIAYDKTVLHSKKDHLEGACNIDTIFAKIINYDLSLNPDEDKHQFSSHGENFYFELSTFQFKNQELKLFMVASSANILQDIQSSFDNILLFTALAVIIILVMVHIVVLLVNKPLSLITAEAIRIRNNDFSPSPYIVTRILELRNLISSIGSMKQSLLEYIQQLRSGQETLQKTIEEKTQALSEALILANEATETKGAFLSTMSHELRTPMNAILGYTYIFDRSNLNNDQKSQLEKIRLSSESLLYIINDILDFSKLEAGKLSIENIPFSLNELLKSTIDIIIQLAEAKGLELILEKDQDLPDFLIGDPNRLRQILINLIGNAIKFTKDGHVKICVKRTVRLQSSKKDTPQSSNDHISIVFSIQDTGIGMTGEQMSTLFQSFSQADASISRKFGGSGLGLNISKQLITLMKGEISVQSKKGQGSEFAAYLTFDLANKNAVTAQAPAKKRKYKEGALALVVDDNQINLEISKALLGKFKVNAETVMSGQEALNCVQTTAYDIIFMDIQMPEMDGLTACTLIRAMANDPTAHYVTNVKDVPIIAMTANALAEDRLKCLSVGMNEHIAKPITPSRLFDVIQEWLAIDDDDTDNDDDTTDTAGDTAGDTATDDDTNG